MLYSCSQSSSNYSFLLFVDTFINVTSIIEFFVMKYRDSTLLK